MSDLGLRFLTFVVSYSVVYELLGHRYILWSARDSDFAVGAAGGVLLGSHIDMSIGELVERPNCRALLAYEKPNYTLRHCYLHCIRIWAKTRVKDVGCELMPILSRFI